MATGAVGRVCQLEPGGSVDRQWTIGWIARIFCGAGLKEEVADFGGGGRATYYAA